MNPIKELPNLPWSETARKQIMETGPDLVAASDVAYRIGDIAAVGLIYESYTSPPWFWFALAEGVTMRHLLDFTRLKDRIPYGALTGVDADNKTELRFAEFYGFKRLGKNLQGYEIMRKE